MQVAKTVIELKSKYYLDQWYFHLLFMALPKKTWILQNTAILEKYNPSPLLVNFWILNYFIYNGSIFKF